MTAWNTKGAASVPDAAVEHARHGRGYNLSETAPTGRNPSTLRGLCPACNT